MNLDGFTPKQIQQARNYAAESSQDMADNAFNHDVIPFADHVTDDDKRAFAAKHEALAKQIRAGELDYNFTIRQRMYYYLTGDCPALLP